MPRSDIPEDIAKLRERLPPELRETWTEFVDARYPTEDEQRAAEQERDRAERRAQAKAACGRAALASRALDGEWGDDVRRAADELVRDVKPEVAILVEWNRRARAGERLTPIELAAARAAVESVRVQEALLAAERLTQEADIERRGQRRMR